MDQDAKSNASFLTPDECSRLVLAFSDRAPSGIRNRALIALLWRNGLRYSEAIALQPSDVNLTRGEVAVWNSSGRRARRLVLEPAVQTLSVNWLNERERMRARQADKSVLPFFCTIEQTNFGKPLSESHIRGLIDRARRKAHIATSVYAESLRDALAIELRSGGFAAKAVSLFLDDFATEGVERYGELPTGDFSGKGVRLSGIATQRSTLDFLVDLLYAVSSSKTRRETGEAVFWQAVHADAQGNVSLTPGTGEDRPMAAERPLLHERVKDLEREVGDLKKAIEDLRRRMKGSDS